MRGNFVVTFVDGPANLTQRVMREQEICRRLRIPGFAQPFATYHDADAPPLRSYVNHVYNLQQVAPRHFVAVYDRTESA